MAVPSNRVPVRVARGLKSALTANLADLLEGELLYAKDEDKLYMVEGGVLVAMGADLAASSIGDLSDVTITSAAVGEVLRWNGTAWVDAQLAYSDLSGAPDIVLDTTPQLGGNLDVNGQQITSTANGNVSVAPNGTGVFEVRGNTNDGSLKLNCTTNTHGVTIKSPPHAAAATYTLVLPTSAGSADQVLKTDGSGNLAWVNQSVPAGSIDDLTDVDTSTTPPTNGQVLGWDGANWVPANQTGGGGGVSGIGVATRASDSGTAASSALTLTGLGSSGLLHTISTDLDAWVVFYGSAADRTADSGRAYNTDPAVGSGVLAEVYVTTAGEVLFTPGTTYLNNDTTETAALYLAVRNQAGAAVNATLTVTAYVQGGYTGVSGGTFGSG